MTTRRTHDGLYIKAYHEYGALWLVVCHDRIVGGLAGCYVEVGDAVSMRNARKRLIAASRRMLRDDGSPSGDIEFAGEPIESVNPFSVEPAEVPDRDPMTLH